MRLVTGHVLVWDCSVDVNVSSFSPWTVYASWSAWKEEKVHLANMSPQGCWQPFSTQEQGKPMESKVTLHRIVCGQLAAHVAR